MRNPNRIDDFCKELATIWKTNCPDWRFGQFIVNVMCTCKRDPFFYEEAEMMEIFRKYFGITSYEDVNT